ncbi:C45 family autoproteolytic acyltransferase/hydolase [Anaeromicropila populeti]|uniref:Predicted choloylglycine hydrolase n=1 Tax=Anaeromicropila populeti TaxID=37658 RepID=A0A1I6JA88_9FIRM|nr:C45 family peptidase [Anaeromicropila populeti]SFR75903.1 Predicted choloylglycine hydrolase [Anaeromicropila populeti]
MDERIRKEVLFKHAVLEGSSYEVGTQLAALYQGRDDYLKLCSTPFYGSAKNTQEEVAKISKLIDQYCPGMNEEIQGFAEQIHKKPQDILLYYSYLGKEELHCSHFAVMPKDTEELYLARNYDYGWDVEPLFLTTKIKGMASHFGFASFLFGRFDGMNEYGVSVTTSGVPISYSTELSGFVFIIAVRAILEHARNVEDAVNILMEMPIGEGRSYIIADSTGKAALVEVAGNEKAYRMMEPKSKQRYLVAANHFSLPEMNQYSTSIVWHSQKRYETMDRVLQNNSSDFDIEDIKSLLSKPVPEGVCTEHYVEGFGTIWSVIFKPMKKKLLVCFGAPKYGNWVEFDFQRKTKNKDYIIQLINEISPSEFWSVPSSEILETVIQKLSKEKDILGVVLVHGYQLDEVWIDEGMDVTVIVSSLGKYRSYYCTQLAGIIVRIHAMTREDLKNEDALLVRSYSTGYPGVLVYTKDETLGEFFKKTFEPKEYGKKIIMFRSAVRAVKLIQQAKISLYRFRDFSGTYLLLINMIQDLAEIEVNLHNEALQNPVLMKAFHENPEFFHSIYTDLIYGQVNEKIIYHTLDEIEAYLEAKADIIFEPVLNYLGKKYEFQGVSDIDDVLGKKYGLSESLYKTLEWLAQKEIILQGTITSKLTYKGKEEFEQLAYFYSTGKFQNERGE